MNFILLEVVLVADFSLLTAIAVSVFFPKHRIWPPPKKDSWEQFVSWALFSVVMFGVPLSGVFDLQSLGFIKWFHIAIGAAFFLLGLGIDLWGTRTLTAQQSLGKKGIVITEGPYRYTRNPQYVGFITLFIGIIFLTLSISALITGAFAILLFFLIPFSEEPWLREQYGKPYEDYCRVVPRFIGYRTFRLAAKKS